MVTIATDEERRRFFRVAHDIQQRYSIAEMQGTVGKHSTAAEQLMVAVTKTLAESPLVIALFVCIPLLMRLRRAKKKESIFRVALYIRDNFPGPD